MPPLSPAVASEPDKSQPQQRQQHGTSLEASHAEKQSPNQQQLLHIQKREQKCIQDYFPMHSFDQRICRSTSEQGCRRDRKYQAIHQILFLRLMRQTRTILYRSLIPTESLLGIPITIAIQNTSSTSMVVILGHTKSMEHRSVFIFQYTQSLYIPMDWA